MKTFQARLIKDDEIVGYCEIFEGIIRAKKLECEYFKYYRNEDIYFDTLEPLAPFKDKDGGDVYAGDNGYIDGEDRIYGIVCYDDWDGWYLKPEDYDARYVFTKRHTFVKLGIIHDKEKK